MKAMPTFFRLNAPRLVINEPAPRFPARDRRPAPFALVWQGRLNQMLLERFADVSRPAPVGGQVWKTGARKEQRLFP